MNTENATQSNNVLNQNGFHFFTIHSWQSKYK